MSKSLKLTNAQVLALSNWLRVQQLHGAESRCRSRFSKLLSDRLDEMEETRLEMLAKLSDKDKKGKPIIVGKSYKMSEDNNKKFAEQWQAYGSEELIIDVLPSNSNEIEMVKQIVLNTQDTFSDEIDNTGKVMSRMSATMYDLICTAFERKN